MTNNLSDLSNILKLHIAGDLCVCKGFKSRKSEFSRFAKKFLKNLAADLGLAKEDFDIRFNAGGPAVSGEATLHTDNLYVQVFGG